MSLSQNAKDFKLSQIESALSDSYNYIYWSTKLDGPNIEKFYELDMEAVAQELSKPDIKVLSLCNLNLASYIMDNFLKIILSGKHDLAELSLKHNNLGLSSISALSEVVHHLTNLNLSNCALDDTSISALGGILANNSTITNLNLAGNHFTDASIPALNQLLSCNSTITHLNLAGNHFTDASIESSMIACTTNTTLQDLNLTNQHYVSLNGNYDIKCESQFSLATAHCGTLGNVIDSTQFTTEIAA